MDTASHGLKQLDLKAIEDKLPAYLANVLLEHDFEVENQFRERGINRWVRFISCVGLVKKQVLMEQMHIILYNITMKICISVHNNGQNVWSVCKKVYATIFNTIHI